MIKLDQRIYEILINKPSLINRFPEWMLPPRLLKEVKGRKDIAIAEIAGRDSFAAIIKASEEMTFKGIIPTVAYTGTEYGSYELLFEKLRKLKQKLKKREVTLYPVVLMGDPSYWHLLCGRYLGVWFKEYGQYSPCVGCHLYLHTIRIPLARILDLRYVIAGEREMHDGRLKINQLKPAIDLYSQFLDEFEIELLLPIRYVDRGEEIERLIGEKWPEGEGQLKCVLSKNYLNENGRVFFNQDAIRGYLLEYAIPTARSKIWEYLSSCPSFRP